jgi:hypothetical protein
LGILGAKPRFCAVLAGFHKSFLRAEIWNQNGVAKRPRLRSISGPQARIRVETDQDPAKAVFGAKDPQLADKIGFILGVGVPNRVPKILRTHFGSRGVCRRPFGNPFNMFQKPPGGFRYVLPTRY